MARALCENTVVIFVGEDKSCKEGEAGNALALSMQPDAAGRSRSQKMATRFLHNALNAHAQEGHATTVPARAGIAIAIPQPGRVYFAIWVGFYSKSDSVPKRSSFMDFMP